MIRVASINITRPANTTAYVSGQRIWTATGATGTSGITSAGSVFYNLGETMFGNGYIVKATLFSNATGISAAAQRLHLYTLSSGQTLSLGTAVGDGAAIAFSYSDINQYVGFIDFPSASFVTGTNYAQCGVTANLAFQRASIRGEGDFSGYGTSPNQVRVGTLVGILEARGAWTPTSGQLISVQLTSDAQEGVSPP